MNSNPADKNKRILVQKWFDIILYTKVSQDPKTGEASFYWLTKPEEGRYAKDRLGILQVVRQSLSSIDDLGVSYSVQRKLLRVINKESHIFGSLSPVKSTKRYNCSNTLIVGNIATNSQYKIPESYSSEPH